MNKIKTRLGDPGSRFYILCLFVFAAATALLCKEYYLAAGEMATALVLLIVHTALARRRQRELMQYIQSVTYESEAARDNAMMNFPLPMAAYFVDSGRLVWGNQEFFTACGRKEPSVNKTISELAPGYQGKWLLEGKSRCPVLVELNGRRYQVHGNLVRGQDKLKDSMGVTYWVDVTDYDDIKQEYAASRPVVMLIMIDNYDELTKNISERAANELRNQLEDQLIQWTEGMRGFLRRYDRNRYIYLCERRYFDKLSEGKFSVLESVHEIVNTSGIHATASVGVGVDGSSLEEDFNFASMSVEMALSRGGDQVVIRDRMNFSFFGGRAAEVETRTMVKSRVIANALSSFIKDASTTFVMGHRYADMDVLGSAVGVCCIARSYGKRVRIVMDTSPNANACGAMIAELKTHKEYEDVFVSPKEAMLQANSRSLLVVVDTNRPEQVEDEALLQTISRLVIIDHHRRAATYIDNAALTFHEPFASSTAELVTELMQELVEQKSIGPVEAGALLAGIVTDTKNFTMRTGERTFEAAAFLRRMGADTVAVKRLLQSDMEATVSRYSILERSKIYRDNICLAVMDHPVDRVVAAQAADEMLNISDVEASVVLYPTEEGGVILSARSIGSLNVQVLLEKLGGGGNQSAAGAQLKDVTIEEAERRLKTAIDEYLDS